MALSRELVKYYLREAISYLKQQSLQTQSWRPFAKFDAKDIAYLQRIGYFPKNNQALAYYQALEQDQNDIDHLKNVLKEKIQQKDQALKALEEQILQIQTNANLRDRYAEIEALKQQGNDQSLRKKQKELKRIQKRLDKLRDKLEKAEYRRDKLKSKLAKLVTVTTPSYVVIDNVPENDAGLKPGDYLAIYYPDYQRSAHSYIKYPLYLVPLNATGDKYGNFGSTRTAYAVGEDGTINMNDPHFVKIQGNTQGTKDNDDYREEGLDLFQTTDTETQAFRKTFDRTYSIHIDDPENNILDTTFIITGKAQGSNLSDSDRFELQPELVNASFTEQLATILEIAHSLNVLHHNTTSGKAVVHGDVKGSNMMRSKKGVYFVDFGLAQPLEDDDPNKLYPTQLKGSPNYLAPEVYYLLRGLKTDMWALTIELLILFGVKEPLKDREAFLELHPEFDKAYISLLEGERSLLENPEFMVMLEEYLQIGLNIDDLQLDQAHEGVEDLLKAFLRKMSAYNYHERPDSIEFLQFFNELSKLNVIFKEGKYQTISDVPEFNDFNEKYTKELGQYLPIFSDSEDEIIDDENLGHEWELNPDQDIEALGNEDNEDDEYHSTVENDVEENDDNEDDDNEFVDASDTFEDEHPIHPVFDDLYKALSKIKNSTAIANMCIFLDDLKIQPDQFEAYMKELKEIAHAKSTQCALSSAWSRSSIFGKGRTSLGDKVYELFNNLNLATMNTTVTRNGRKESLPLTEAIQMMLDADNDRALKPTEASTKKCFPF